MTALIGMISNNPLTGTKAAEVIASGSIIALILVIRFFLEARTNGVAKKDNAD
jgi:hypothetical protein